MVLRRSDNSTTPSRINLPLVKSKKTGTLKLSAENIANYETVLDSGREV